MRGLLKAVSLSLFGLMSVGLTACGGSDSDVTTVVRVDVTPSTASLAEGQTVQLRANATYSDGTTSDVTAQALWTSSNPTAASVSAGSVTGLRQSETPITISAVFDGVLGTATVTVAYVVRVDVTPASATVAKGATLQLQAVATYSDSTTRNVTAQAAWTTTNPGVATVSDAGDGKGRVTGVQQNDAPVTIRAVFEQIQGEASITVGEPEPIRIEVSPAAPTVAKGTTLQLQAVAVYSDDSTQNVTAQALWTSDAPAVASVGNDGGNKGLVTGLTQRAAPVAISAEFGDVSGDAAITVGAPLPVRIEVTPATLSLPNGTTQPLTATAVFTDNSTEDVTVQAEWTSSAPAVVAVGNDAGTEGKVTGAAVTATAITVTATLGTLTDAAEVTVTAAVLDEIQITPSNAQVPSGLTQQFSATGVFTDNSTQDVTAAAQWVSSAPAVATVGNTVDDKGLLTGVAASEDPVTLTATIGAVSGTTSVTITDGVLQQIDVQPASVSLPRFGFRTRFTAIGTLSDGSTVDLTSQATWTSSAAETVATIDNTGSNRGVATSGNTAGTSQILATLGSVESAPATLSVTNAVLQSIELQADDDAAPETELALSLGRSLDLRAIGVFSSGGASSRQDITQSVTWSSCVEAPDVVPCVETDDIATVSNVAATRGRVVTQSPGDAVIGASIAINDGTTTTTRTTSLELTVNDATLVALEVSPSTQALPRDFRTAFTAMGTFTDGSVDDVTDEATWVSSDSNVVTLSNIAGEVGVAKGGAAGTAQIIAKWPSTSIEDSAVVTVTDAVLTGIAVTPTNSTIKQGQTRAFVASGQFSGDTTLDITRFNGVSWSVSDASVADFLTAAAPNRATGLAQGGPVAVTATKVPPNSGLVTGSTNLTVAGYALRQVFIVPATAEGCALDVSAEEYEPMPRGYQRGFLACAEFFNGTVEEVTDEASWSTQAAAVVSVSNAAGSKGLATAAAAAFAGEQGVIRAQYTADDITLAGSYTVRIVSVSALTIAGEPAPAAPLTAGAVVQFTALASFEGTSFADNDDVDVTELATWASSKASVATISNTAGSRGRATVQDEPASEPPPPSTEITASFGGAASNAVTITRAD